MALKPDLGSVAQDDGRYHVEGFHFIGQALAHAVKLFRSEQTTGAARHLIAHELVQGAVDLAATRYGLLGGLVLSSWGIRRSEDIGEITFSLIEHGIFTKQPEDRLEDFAGHEQLAAAVRDSVRKRLGLGDH
jgi:uncharacterized repeat protein (TIGR04138 family)